MRKCGSMARGVRLGRGVRVAGAVVPVTGAVAETVVVPVEVEEVGGRAEVAVRVGASVIVARGVGVEVGVGDWGSKATRVGCTAKAPMTSEPSTHPTENPRTTATTSCFKIWLLTNGDYSTGESKTQRKSRV